MSRWQIISSKTLAKYRKDSNQHSTKTRPHILFLLSVLYTRINRLFNSCKKQKFKFYNILFLEPLMNLKNSGKSNMAERKCPSYAERSVGRSVDTPSNPPTAVQPAQAPLTNPRVIETSHHRILRSRYTKPGLQAEKAELTIHTKRI